MAKYPAFLFYTNDFISGTQFMTNEEVGVYIRLLCAQHQHGRLSEKQVLFICNSLDSEVLNKFDKDDNNLYYNSRLEIEINRRKSFSESRANNRLGKTKDTKKQVKKTRKTYVNHMETENKDETKDIIKDIVYYLNNICKTKYLDTSEKTKELIKARLNQGFTLEDFKTVIDKKYKEWGKDAKMIGYLRPETLFSNKFESYLNQIEIKPETNYQNGINIDEIWKSKI